MADDDALSEQFLTGLRQLGLDGNAQLVQQVLRYRQELLDWNTRINLTAITEPEEVLSKHFLDSFSLITASARANIEPARLLDIGSGAGFPGLPLALARPRWSVTLLEATGKKVTFLRHVIEVLALKNVTVVQGRAEDLGHERPYRARFDLVTARAVAALPVLLEYCAPFCRKGGRIILPKKGDLSEEVSQGKHAAHLLGAALKADMPVTLPGLDDGRRLLVWEQQLLCPPPYPRSGALISKKPLS